MQVLRGILVFCWSLLATAQSCLANDVDDRARFPVPGAPFAWVQACCGFSWDPDRNLPRIAPRINKVLTELNSRLYQTWSPAAGCNSNEPMPLRVTIHLSKDGQISNVMLRNSCGVAETDSSLVEALKKISSVKPLDDGILNLDLTLMFSYERRNTGRVTIVDSCN